MQKTDIACVRPFEGLHPKYYFRIIGKKLKKKYKNWRRSKIRILLLRNILFRLDYNKNIGGGHLQRCLLISEILKNFNSFFLIECNNRKDKKNVIKILNKTVKKKYFFCK